MVHAWSLPAVAGGAEMLSASQVEDLQRSAEELLAGDASHLRQLESDIELETRLEYGSPIALLLELAADANLIVVGSRGMGRVVGLLLGSVSQAVVNRASSPVVVVPPATGKLS